MTRLATMGAATDASTWPLAKSVMAQTWSAESASAWINLWSAGLAPSREMEIISALSRRAEADLANWPDFSNLFTARKLIANNHFNDAIASLIFEKHNPTGQFACPLELISS